MERSEFITKASEKRFCENYIYTVFGGHRSTECEVIIYAKEFYENALKLVKSLSETKSQVMEMLLREGKSKEEIGNALNMDEETVECNIAGSLRFLRHPNRSKQFFRFVVRLEDDLS